MKNIMIYSVIGIALFSINDAYARRIITSGVICSGNVVTEDGMTWCDGNEVVCPVGYYCPGDYSQVQCPTGTTSSQGATAEEQCYDPNAPTITLETEGVVSDETLGTEDDGAIVTTAAVWEPNTININWKNASGETMTTSTCSYDGSVTLPSQAPTKRGYTFTGWKTNQSVLTQAAQSMLSQANQSNQGVLSLLQ